MGYIKRVTGNYPFLTVVFGFQLFRLMLLPFMGLMPQDAYYYFYGQNLALSYFDHPGMIAYILRLFTTVFGAYPFVIKLADFTVSSLTIYSFYVLAGYFLPERKQKRALVLFVTTALVSILSTISTPDVPLLLFWTFSLIALYKAVFEQKNGYWLFAGLFMGLAFDSKYSAVFLQIGLIIFLILSYRYRHLLLSKWLWLCLTVSLLTTFPVFYWNYQNHYASFLFQSTGRSQTITQFNLNLKTFFGTVGHQAFILLPVLFLSIATVTYKYARKSVLKFCLPDGKPLFLLAFFAPVFVGFFIISLFYWVKINWMMPAYITGIILVAGFISQKLVRANVIFSAVVHILLAVEIVFYVVPVKSDDTWYGWEQLAGKMKERKKTYPGTFIFSDDNYKTTAELGFYMHQKIYAQNVIGKKALQYDYIGDNLLLLKGGDALFIDSEPGLDDKNRNNEQVIILAKYFLSVRQLEPVVIKKGNRVVRKFWIYHCKNYKGPVLMD